MFDSCSNIFEVYKNMIVTNLFRSFITSILTNKLSKLCTFKKLKEFRM